MPTHSTNMKPEVPRTMRRTLEAFSSDVRALKIRTAVMQRHMTAIVAATAAEKQARRIRAASQGSCQH
jgi:hypothetical protein